MRRAAVTALALLAAGCGDGDAGRPPAAGTPASGGGLTVEEARATDSEGPLLVRGFYVARAGGARLCSALAESHPPQCGEPSLRLEPPTPPGATKLESAGGVSWTTREISLLGDVEGGVLRISETSR